MEKQKKGNYSIKKLLLTHLDSFTICLGNQ